MTSDESVCPVCEQSVDTVVRRHKTLGVFVPVWAPGPCPNPRCARHAADEESEGAGAAPAPPGTSRTGPERDR
ncbi:hypothetical protein QFZ75_002626 [Streptomyces sp. V3I8]|uniref:hypothetical protein n=1 Tax=Streptomyces sp. V3I8 TaxID=3042279 RepID=UPI002782CE4C|nr:hypothetical protein [Streptomyces sp. V3I8]MDQ1036210.1 hypothetical protein [Streptomyces sp. V3I8]